MTSLPMSPGAPQEICICDPALFGSDERISSGRDPERGQAGEEPDRGGEKDGQFLLQAFRSFSQAARSLECSYEALHTEVARLRHELEQRNSELGRSLEQNLSMRAHLDRILEGLPCGVLVVSREGTIARANPEALRLMGVQDRAGAPSPANISSLHPGIQRLLGSAERSIGEQELCLSDEASPGRWLSARYAVLSHGAVNSSIFILRDVTERKRLEQEREKMRRQQALAEMATLLAHEVRNPLGSLELFAGLLAEAGLDEEPRHWVAQLQAGLRILAATVNNVLHFHSLPEPERSALDIGSLLDWAGEFLTPLAEQSGVGLRVKHQLGGVSLAADRHRLGQVLQNLVINAVRAQAGGGSIRINGHRARDRESVIITVADNGPGISAANLAHIFEPGFTTRAGSPGLGLAVCRRIVEQHGGTLRASSPPGSGAIFILALPLAGRMGGSA
ncbi:MAG TPA: ATP-binding protein [Silvibacterium sp.]|nr:ATP-binding protein [Silvibacterium sp.]